MHGLFLSKRIRYRFSVDGFLFLKEAGTRTMTWNFLFFFNSILLGVGLAMDAFSVSLANGMSDPSMSRRRSFLIAGTFGAFQALMPMFGWVLVHTAAEKFEAFRKFIPWIALILLCWIGGKMLAEGIRKRRSDDSDGEENAVTALGIRVLLVQGIATSIDALSVGFTIAEYGWAAALVESLLIALVTFAICLVGVRLGRKFGTFLAWRASILGGLILIAIGIEIFVKGFFS